MKYVLLLMGNLADERCGETEDGPGVEEFIAFDAELEKAGVLAGGFGLTDPEEGTSVTRADAEAEAVITAPDGSTRTEDVTPDEYRDLPVPTQTIY